MFKKAKNFLSKAKGKIYATLVGACVFVLGAIPAFADGDPEYVTGIRSLWTSITSELNITNIVAVIAICIGSCIAAVLFWFGLRYVSRKIITAVKSGKFKA